MLINSCRSQCQYHNAMDSDAITCSVSINQINIKTLSKHVIEGLTMVVDDGGMIPDIG